MMGLMSEESRSGLRVSPALTIPEPELRWRFSRSSGPGGQGVNTTDSRVELSWDIGTSVVLTAAQRQRLSTRLANRITGGVLTIAASQYRSQLRNREAARDRLGALVADALATRTRRRATRPTRGSKERRLAAKKSRGQTKALRRQPPTD